MSTQKKSSDHNPESAQVNATRQPAPMQEFNVPAPGDYVSKAWLLGVLKVRLSAVDEALGREESTKEGLNEARGARSALAAIVEALENNNLERQDANLRSAMDKRMPCTPAQIANGTCSP